LALSVEILNIKDKHRIATDNKQQHNTTFSFTTSYTVPSNRR